MRKIPTDCRTLREALESLQADHKFLLEGGVFTEDMIDAYIDLKMEEVLAYETRPHPVEFEMITAFNMWAVAALLAAVFWGFAYAASERYLKLGLVPAFMMGLSSLCGVPIYTFLAWRSTDLKQQVLILKNNPLWGTVAVCTIFIYLAANYLSFYAIQQKNATISSILEMTYPLFTVFFVWLIFRETHLNWGIAFGASLIFTGIGFVLAYTK